jgi:colanic acid biosynthesis glycosyl transferase WcaI
MRVLVLVVHYLPDGGPSAPLYGMLCERLARRGHEVTVVSAVPHYPTGQVQVAYRGRPWRRTEENGVTVIRLWIPSVDRKRLLWRIVQFSVFQLGAALASLTLNPDVVIAATPALGIWLPYSLLVWLRRKAAIYSVHDVYPEVGIKLGVFQNPAVIRVVSWLEQSCLAGAAQIRILSESFIPAIKGLGVPQDKLTLVYDWADTDFIQPLPRENSFSVEQGLDGKFVVLYAGNMGLTHGLRTIVDAAMLLKDHPGIRFLFVGEGGGKDTAIAHARECKLSNVCFLPYQPRERLPEILASADVSLVTLQQGLGHGSLPSKTFSILASGRPIIACVDPASDTWNLIARSGAGICVPPDDPGALAEAVTRLTFNPELRQSCALNGRTYALAHHSPEKATIAFEHLLQNALRPSRKRAASRPADPASL